MKVRVVLITENNSPVESIGDNAEHKIKAAWEVLLGLVEMYSQKEDRGYVESVEILDTQKGETV